MYADASKQTLGDTARFVSPRIDTKPGTKCLEFYYSQYGIDMGTFSVYGVTDKGETLLWRTVGEGMDTIGLLLV